MKKSLLIAIGMACTLFIYGYIASSMGHDHSKHDAQHSHADDGHHH